MKNSIATSHNLDFMACRWDINPQFTAFKVGTCNGLYFVENKSYCILSIINEMQGNGHMDDVFEWFEFSCRREGYKLKILEVMTDRFEKHLIEKRGFVSIGGNNLEKIYC